MSEVNSLASLVGRIMLAAIFIPAGYNKIIGYDGTAGYMESAGVPGLLLPLVILAELGGGLAILLGFMTRWAALGLAIFCVVAAALFHAFWADASQYNSFMKNIAIAGGLLILFANGPGKYAARD